MKTPREILLDSHQSAAPKLDAIRQNTLASLAQLSDREPFQNSASPSVAVSFPAFVRSIRWHLAGMTAVWLVSALLNADPLPKPATTATRQKVASPRQLLTALRENRRQLLELMGSPFPEPAPVPRTLIPQRRGDVQSPTAMI